MGRECQLTEMLLKPDAKLYLLYDGKRSEELADEKLHQFVNVKQQPCMLLKSVFTVSHMQIKILLMHI